MSDEVSVYPNPTNGVLNINAAGMKRVVVMNMLGQVVYDAPADTEAVSLDLSQYGAGMYLIRIDTENGTVVKKVSVTK